MLGQAQAGLAGQQAGFAGQRAGLAGAQLGLAQFQTGLASLVPGLQRADVGQLGALGAIDRSLRPSTDLMHKDKQHNKQRSYASTTIR